MNPIPVDVISDVVCPWCFIGKRRLEKALGTVDAPVEVRWHPYQLDPTIPREGIDRQIYLQRKFGSPEDIARIQKPVVTAGEAEGIAFAMDRITRSPNTLNAHRLIRAAGAQGLQEALVERLFRLYFIEGGDLTQAPVLTDAAVEAGMERTAVEGLLQGEEGLQEVEAEIEQARQLGVTGVPTFIVGGRYAVVGAREAEFIAGAITKAAAEAA